MYAQQFAPMVRSEKTEQEYDDRCLIHSLHAESDNILYKGSCSLWDVGKITIK